MDDARLRAGQIREALNVMEEGLDFILQARQEHHLKFGARA